MNVNGFGAYGDRASARLYDIDTLVPKRLGSILHFTDPFGVNASGQIAAGSYLKDPNTHVVWGYQACILTPY